MGESYHAARTPSSKTSENRLRWEMAALVFNKKGGHLVSAHSCFRTIGNLQRLAVVGILNPHAKAAAVVAVVIIVHEQK